MTGFMIHFTFKKQSYSAAVMKRDNKPQEPVHFHVFEFTPSIKGFPNQLTFTATPSGSLTSSLKTDKAFSYLKRVICKELKKNANRPVVIF